MQPPLAPPPTSVRSLSIPVVESSLDGLKSVVVPFGLYAPETGLALGVGLLNLFSLGGDGHWGRPSNIRSALIYTLKNQFAVTSDSTVFLPGDHYEFRSQVIYSKYSDKFFGIGPETKANVYENYLAELVFTKFSLLKNLGGDFFAGLQYMFNTLFDVERSSGALLDPATVAGANGSRNSSIGFLVAQEKRNSILTPTEGHFMEFSVNLNRKVFDSDYDCTSYQLDLRTYRPFFAHGVLAARFLGMLKFGEMPFHYLSFFGGPFTMRGYYAGRFRDNDLALVDLEYRQPLLYGFGATVFGGVGDVAHTPTDFAVDRLKYTTGFGLRYAVDKQEHTNIRADFGWAKDMSGIYVYFGEAF